MEKQTIRDIDLAGKKVLCRVDFNVPIHNGIITDETRINAALPTIKYLQDSGARVILITHLGRPKGEVVEELRLTPVAKRLSEILNQQVNKTNTVYGPEVTKEVEKLKDGELLLLENVRFEAGEEKNDPELVEHLANLADIYVNDAFGTAHRAHASTAGVASKLPALAGFLMEKEIKVLGQALDQPERPFTAIIGGSKVKDKINVINNLIEKVDNILIGGGLAYTFLKAEGYEIGNSLVEDDKLELAKSFIKKAKDKNVNFVLQTDAVVADEFSKDANYKTVGVGAIEAGWMGLDIGPESRSTYEEIISNSNLIVWNGPMGVFEMEQFANGTKSVADALSKTKGYSIIGGGDSAAAVEQFSLSKQMDHISTGGGASLEFMEGKELPGIKELNDKEEV